MNNPVLIGNLFSLIGCTLMVLVGLIRKRKTILAVQCIQFSFQAVANIVLGGVSGFIANIISIVKNLVFFKGKQSLILKIAFVAAQIILSLGHLNSLVQWFPIFAAAIFTWFLDTKNETVLKGAIISAQVLWLIYDLVHLNYTGALFDIFAVVSNVVGILMIKKATK